MAFDVRKLRRTDGQSERVLGIGGLDVTPRQHEVAATATEMGYFDEQGATAEDVAAELEISPSTVSSHLRAVTAKVFKHLFQ